MTRRRWLIRGLVLVATIACAARAAFACLWDSDTLRYELKGIPEVAQVAAGRFDRFPALYYQMRLERASALLAEHPDDLNAYDDAAVACDRLERGDEGLEWLGKKRAALDRADHAKPDVREHEYRLHANRGTLLAHRWVRHGANIEEAADLAEGRDEIARAIELNPDAHFGRERVQLLAMEWLLHGPEGRNAGGKQTILDARGGPGTGGDAGRDEYAKAAQGLAGLVVLGNAWESVDVFVALAATLELQQKASAGMLCRLRARELFDQGRRPLRLDCIDAQTFRETAIDLPAAKWLPDENIQADVQAFFKTARDEAEAWRAKRNAYVLERLEAGRHPDSDPAFWDDWKDAAPPPPPGSDRRSLTREEKVLWTAAGAGAVIAALAVLTAWRIARAMRVRRAKAAGVAIAKS